MVTCIDISTLYKEKRGKSILLVEHLARFKHINLVDIYHYWVVPEHLIFIEMECPKFLSKNFVKRNLPITELLNILEQVVTGLTCLHKHNYTLRDVHPSRI